MNDEPKRPVQATIFTYQVGFGDCILIRITYSDGHLVHILNDFGTKILEQRLAESWILSSLRTGMPIT